MENLLDMFFETMEFSMKRKFNMYIVKVSQVKEAFYVLIKKPRGKILGDDLMFMVENLKYIWKKYIFYIEIQVILDISFSILLIGWVLRQLPIPFSSCKKRLSILKN